MRICFTLDDVLRDKTIHILKMYKKYINPDFDTDDVDLTKDIKEIIGYSKDKYNKFLYEDYPFEIFGEGPVVEKGLDKKFNLWHLSINDNDDIEEPVEIIFANPMEFNASIGFTNFFLSKIATRVREYFFPTNSNEIWNKCDVLITADKKLLENKPEGKTAIKIAMPYNKEVESDYEYETLNGFLEDADVVNKLIGKND